MFAADIVLTNPVLPLTGVDNMAKKTESKPWGEGHAGYELAVKIAKKMKAGGAKQIDNWKPIVEHADWKKDAKPYAPGLNDVRVAAGFPKVETASKPARAAKAGSDPLGHIKDAFAAFEALGLTAEQMGVVNDYYSAKDELAKIRADIDNIH